ncbi:MAG: NUDIX hydrolase [archaeon]
MDVGAVIISEGNLKSVLLVHRDIGNKSIVEFPGGTCEIGELKTCLEEEVEGDLNADVTAGVEFGEYGGVRLFYASIPKHPEITERVPYYHWYCWEDLQRMEEGRILSPSVRKAMPVLQPYLQ